MESIEEECNSVVEEVCERFEYEKTHKDFKDVLKRIAIVLVSDSSKEDRDVFYQMLKHTPIVVVENLTEESLKELKEKYVGTKVEEQSEDMGKYGIGIPEGEFVARPCIDDNGQLVGKNSFLYIQNLKTGSKASNLLGTDINVPHLIHELGHAWHSEKEQYKILEDGTLLERVGGAKFKYSLEKTEEGKWIQKGISHTGLLIEEGMNTIEEEVALAKYLNISREEMKEKYKGELIPTIYRGFVATMVEDFLDKTDRKELEEWRMYGEESKIKKVENWMELTDAWKNREKEYGKEGTSLSNKKLVFAGTQKPVIQDFFKKYEKTFFPDISNMTPVEKIENVLEQLYTFKGIQYHFSLTNTEEKENYNSVVMQMLGEGYSLINQTQKVRDNLQKRNIIEEIGEAAKGITKSRIVSVTRETKGAVKEREHTKEDKQGEEERNE